MCLSDTSKRLRTESRCLVSVQFTRAVCALARVVVLRSRSARSPLAPSSCDNSVFELIGPLVPTRATRKPKKRGQVAGADRKKVEFCQARTPAKFRVQNAYCKLLCTTKGRLLPCESIQIAGISGSGRRDFWEGGRDDPIVVVIRSCSSKKGDYDSQVHDLLAGLQFI